MASPEATLFQEGAGWPLKFSTQGLMNTQIPKTQLAHAAQAMTPPRLNSAFPASAGMGAVAEELEGRWTEEEKLHKKGHQQPARKRIRLRAYSGDHEEGYQGGGNQDCL